MRLAMIGTGYVGLVAGVGFSDFGNDVVCVDIDKDRIERLKRGEIPIYEPGLSDLVKRNLASGRLSFTSNLAEAVRGAEAIFIAVGTPQSEKDGAADLSYVLDAAHQVGHALTDWAVIVTKSTVPVGTGDKVREAVRRGTKLEFSVASNPEFLKEGDAINDFMKPPRVIIGVEDDRARQVLTSLYSPFVRTNDRIHVMDVKSAELSKYAANAMLAARISFMNELALLAEKVGADIEKVRKGIGSDPRIGPKFLFPGVGYGGSCLLGRESVLVRERGEVALRRFDSFFDEEATETPEASVLTPSDLEVLSLSSSGSPQFTRVETITRRHYEGEIVDVRTKMGRRVLATTDHPFVVLDENGEHPDTKAASDLTQADWLPVVNLPTAGVVEKPCDFDLLSVIDQLGIPIEEIIVRVGGDAVTEPATRERLRETLPRTRFHDVMRKGVLRLHEARAANVSLETATLGTCRSGTYVPRRIPNTPEFWRMLGLFASEGWISFDAGRDGAERLRTAWAFHPRDEEHLVREVVDFWASIGVDARVYTAPTTRKVTISSRILARFLLRVLRVGGDAYTKSVADALWTQPTENKRAYLAGLWLGDGSWSYVTNKKGVVFEYGTVSRKLADGMLRLLAEEGIVASWKVGRPPKSTVDTHFLRVSGAEQVSRMMHCAHPGEEASILAAVGAATKRIAPTGYRGEGTVRVRVTSTERRPYQGWVYSMEAPESGTLITTGGLVVHNCFPKDVRALLHTAHDAGTTLHVVDAVERANERQKHVLAERIVAHFDGKLAGKRIAIWGLAFKPETDDIREAPALVLVDDLSAHQVTIVTHDPVAMDNVRDKIGDRVEYATDMYEAARGADALVLVTEWHSFRRPDFPRLKSLMNSPVVFDGRNIWNPEEVRGFGFSYSGIGRP